MRILYVADGRSPTAINWIKYFLDRGHEIHLASTYPTNPLLQLASLSIIPVAFSQAAQVTPSHPAKDQNSLIKRISTASMRTRFRQFFGPLTLRKAAVKLENIVNRIKPDLIHALRIPYEGMLASMVNTEVPLLVSVWGNDFTLHAGSTPLMRRYTRNTLKRADSVMVDCHRDLRLAAEWGFEETKPEIVLPGGGGVDLELFHPPKTPRGTADTVINPRGMRAYVRNDTFFKSIPLVLAHKPQVQFLCPTMRDEPQAQKWIHDLSINQNVHLLPSQSHTEMAALFRKSNVAVSPSEHDGTPNTLLEAIASGCFPIAGDIESLREWIEPGVNGFLFDPNDPQALANGIIRALNDSNLRAAAQAHNTQLIADKAERHQTMSKAEMFYKSMLKSNEGVIQK